MENKTVNKVKLATNFCVYWYNAASKVVNKIKQDKNKVKRLEVETPLAACLYLPGNGARKNAACDGKAHVRWEPQEEGMMSTAASFPSVRNQGLPNQ